MGPLAPSGFLGQTRTVCSAKRAEKGPANLGSLPHARTFSGVLMPLIFPARTRSNPQTCVGDRRRGAFSLRNSNFKLGLLTPRYFPGEINFEICAVITASVRQPATKLV
jgi:hypothetical protein